MPFHGSDGKIPAKFSETLPRGANYLMMDLKKKF